MSILCGSSEAAEELRFGLIDSLRQLVQIQSDIQRRLNHLQQLCQDESYEQMSYFCMLLENQLKMLLPEISDINIQLERYSEFIQSLDNKYRGSSFEVNLSNKISRDGNVENRTTQVWHKEEKGFVYDSPREIASMLDTAQGKSGLNGSCGICSVENVILISGGKATEIDVYNTARGHQPYSLCEEGGGTTPLDRQSLLEKYGIASSLENQTIENIASAINSGRICILSVDARKLYRMKGLQRQLHAVVVTSVTVDEKGDVTEVTICDSNASALGQSGAQEYSVQELKKALTKRPMNVTDVIR